MTKPKAKTEGTPPKPRKRGLTKQEFAEAHDYQTRTRLAIRRVLRDLKADEILRDHVFRAECGVAAGNGWREIAESAEFLPYQFRVSDREIFWAVKATVEWACGNVAKARRLE